MPNQRLFACLRKYIPQLLRLAEAAVQIVIHLVQMLWVLPIEICNAMNCCVASCRQRRPHRGGYCWMPA